MHYKRPQSLIQNPMRQEHGVFVQEQRIVIYLYKDIKEINKYITVTHSLHLSVKPFHDRKGKHFVTERGVCFMWSISQS